MNKLSKMLLAFAAGAAAGVAAGILFAPDKGSETRRKMRESGEDLASDLKQRYEAAKKRFECLKKEMDTADGQQASS
ncbi:YtxH domain-containing protein [Paraflavitalea pollutisoli]|uniref:YtxH domain-containing protein n=1 Tax=Paraflavitalea pollutisoli TaxID=3034143 RepID=UPI0023EDB50E|nr:YtxH domain-containing protein [Paraflavitalea sp. H1-2-19X]